MLFLNPHVTTEIQFLEACLYMCTHSNLILPATHHHAPFPNEKVEAICSYEAEVYLEYKPCADSDYNH